MLFFSDHLVIDCSNFQLPMLSHFFLISKGVDATKSTQVLEHTIVVLINVGLHQFPRFKL